MKTAFESPEVWRPFGCNSMGLVVGKEHHVLLTGQVAWDENRCIVGVGDMRAQAQQVFRNIQATLRAIGGEIDDVVSIVTYVTTPEGLRDIHEVRTEFFSPPYPVSTLVQVAGLVESDLLIEVTATAIIPESHYRAPKAITPDSFDKSDGGFNI
jgi:enamine deaminase RidA (YjgF/YER057c/UK114 family)